MLRALSRLGDMVSPYSTSRSNGSSSLSDVQPYPSSPLTPPPSPKTEIYLTPADSVKRRRRTAAITTAYDGDDDETQFRFNQIPEAPITPLGKPKRRKAIKNGLNHPPTPDGLPRGRRKSTRKIPVVQVDVPTTPKQVDTVVVPSEKGLVEPVGKIHLIQERVRHDPWRMLVATSLLNVTSGRAARPVYEELIRRWPNAQSLASADMTELVPLLYPLGLFNQRASSLIRFSQQYIDLAWPSPSLPQNADIPTSEPPPLPTSLDVRIFHGAGVYASDSFRIYSDLLPGRGGPEKEKSWLDKRERAIGRMRENVARGLQSSDEEKAQERTGSEVVERGVEQVGEWLSDEEGNDVEDEWRSVRPKDKELRRYLIWRWGLEGIIYDIKTGPKLNRERDAHV